MVLTWYHRCMEPKVTKIALMLRLPEVIHLELTKKAEDNHRSLNSEITFRLSESLTAEKVEKS